MKLKVLFASYYDRTIAEAIFKKLDASIDMTWTGLKRTLSENELLELLPGHHGVVSADEVYTKNIFQQAKGLKFIAREGAGFDNVPLDLASRYGVAVFNAPVIYDAVADLAMAMILNLARRIIHADKLVRCGCWNDRGEFAGVELKGKTLGIIGMGRVGKTLATRALAFGMKIVGCDTYTFPGEILDMGIRQVILDELLAVSDFVSVHTPLTRDTEGMLNKQKLGFMKQGAFLINTARGRIIDEKALYGMLASGHLGGAALDVFEKEPVEADNPLFQLDNVLVTPHIGGDTVDTFIKALKCVADNIEEFISGRRPENLLNPEVYEDYIHTMKG